MPVDVPLKPRTAWRGSLETAANAAVVVAVVVFLFNTMLGPRVPSAPRGYAVGDEVPTVPGYDYSSAASTVVLFLNSDCAFCTASMPFYRQLASGAAKQPGVAVVVVGVEPATTLQEYLRTHSVQAPRLVAQIDGHAWVGFHATPTLLLVDSRGVVLEEHVGVVDTREEARLLAHLAL